MKVQDKLAWLLLTRQKMRFFIASAGISFACILIFMQLGFLEALFMGASKPHQLLDADLVLAHPKLQTFFSPQSFPRARLFQANGLPEVASVSPLRLGTLQWRNPITHQLRSILVFGVDPNKASFTLPEVNRYLPELKLFRRVLFDQASRVEYGPIAELFNSGKVEVELNKKIVRVAGLFKIGASFAADGTVITSDTTFPFIFSQKNSGDVELGLIKVKTAQDISSVKQVLTSMYGKEVAVYTKADFAEVEKRYWAEGTGIGFIFGLGVVVGFIVGVVIVYQILHSDVADHLQEYATLKAIGYPNNYLLQVVFKESAILSLTGFIPAYVIAYLLYRLAEDSTSLPIFMTGERGVLVYLLSASMCLISASIALQKLRHADPAEVF
ncbi:MAG: FtsX-like permease family protein [Candidatus Melainabacteria bacterium]|nr:FtsX-like permease family protein [Candidatus Melainabacteria bacterium]